MFSTFVLCWINTTILSQLMLIVTVFKERPTKKIKQSAFNTMFDNDINKCLDLAFQQNKNSYNSKTIPTKNDL